MIDAAIRMRILHLSGDDLVPPIRNRQPSVAALFYTLNPKRTFGVRQFDKVIGVKCGEICAANEAGAAMSALSHCGHFGRAEPISLRQAYW